MNQQDNQDIRLIKASKLYKDVQEVLTSYAKGLKELGYEKVEGGSNTLDNNCGVDAWCVWCHPDYVKELNLFGTLITYYY